MVVSVLWLSDELDLDFLFLLYAEMYPCQVCLLVLSHNLRKENNEGQARTLHRNLLLPIGYIRDVPTPAPRKLLKRPKLGLLVL
jgi:hypothetical protein